MFLSYLHKLFFKVNKGKSIGVGLATPDRGHANGCRCTRLKKLFRIFRVSLRLINIKFFNYFTVKQKNFERIFSKNILRLEKSYFSRIVSFYFMFVLFLRSVCCKYPSGVVYFFTFSLLCLKFFFSISFFTAVYLWISFGFNLIFYDLLGSHISTFYEQNSLSTSKLFLISSLNHKNVVRRYVGKNAYSALLIGTTPMTASGRAALIAGLITGVSWLANDHLNRRHLATENERSRVHTAQENERSRVHTAQENERSRMHAAAEGEKARQHAAILAQKAHETELARLHVEEQRLKFEQDKYNKEQAKKDTSWWKRK